MSSKTTYLISGANRGIGRGLAEAFLSRPNTTVIAAVRDPNNETSRSLDSVHVGSGSKLHVVKLDSSSETDAKDAVEHLKTKENIDHIDCVIANSGIGTDYSPATAVSPQALREHFEVNTLGPLLLFQATWPLLLQAAKQPKFVVISSILASIGAMEQAPMPTTAYGSSKAAINYVTRKIHFENEGLIAFPLHPGWVQTDMGNTGAVSMGMKEAPVTLKDSVQGIVDKIDGATREKTSGHFPDFEGNELPW